MSVTKGPVTGQTGLVASPTNDVHDTPQDQPADQAADPRPASSPLARLGFAPGQVVQELGDDDDVDETLRADIEALTGTTLVDGEYGDVVDACVLWFRDEDGDLTDAVVDSLTDLEDQAFVLLLTPKAGRPGHVEAAEIAEAATTAGLMLSGSLSTCPSWAGVRLSPPKHARR